MATIRIALGRQSISAFTWFYDLQTMRFHGMGGGALGMVGKIRIHGDDAVLGVHLGNRDDTGKFITEDYIMEAVRIFKSHGYVPHSAVACGDLNSWQWGWQPDVEGDYEHGGYRKRAFLELFQRELEIDASMWGAGEGGWVNRGPGDWGASLQGGEVRILRPGL